jgi:DUF1009 family protein
MIVFYSCSRGTGVIVNLQKAIKELERLGFKVIPPNPQAPKPKAPTSNFGDHSPRVQDALRNIVKNDNLW